MRAITTPQPLARSRLITSDSSPSPFRAIVNPFVDIVVPVLNEEKILQSSIETLEQFKQLVADGKLKYYAASSRGHGGGPNGGNSEITNWIKKNGKVVNYGGSDVTLYELSA